MSGTDAKQRLVDLDVGEVSIVDVPANEEPFVVTKAKSPAVQGADVADVNKAGGVQLDPYTATSVTMNAMRDCLYNLGDKLRDPSKLDDAKAEIERIKLMLDNASQFSAMITKAMTEITAEITKAKGDSKKAPPFMKEQMAKLIETMKAAMGEDDEETDEAKTQKAMAAVEVILKAGKAQFSKERMTKLHEAFVHLSTMYKEADSVGFAKAMDEMKPATAQTDSGSATEGGGPKGPNVEAGKPATEMTSTTKAADVPPAWFTAGMDTIKKSIDDVKATAQAATQEVVKRVETIEKVEAVSKALPHNGTDNVQKVEKSESLWKGIV